MTSAKFGQNWADVDEDSDTEQHMDGAKFETGVDEHGVKMIISYEERDGRTYKVTRKVKQTVVSRRVHAAVEGRKELAKFGKVVTNDPKEEASHVKKQEDEVAIDLVKKAVSLAAKDDAEDRFLEEAFKATDGINKKQRAWADVNREAQVARDKDDAPRAVDSVALQMAVGAGAAAQPKAGGPQAYVPPSMRDGAKGKGKGDGKDGKGDGQEASLRVTNLSEDAREGDLQNLFARFGRLQRVYLARDQLTQLSRGFAFVTYFHRTDAQNAIDGLHGHGYDNLIMQVSWAKPRL